MSWTDIIKQGTWPGSATVQDFGRLPSRFCFFGEEDCIRGQKGQLHDGVLLITVVVCQEEGLGAYNSAQLSSFQ